MPADDARRNLVAKREGQHRRVMGQLLDLPDDFPPNAAGQPSIVEERLMLRPREPDHDTKSMARRFVEQIQPRRGVGADRVDAESRHQAEVLGHLCQRWELVSVGAWCERSVRHTFDEEPNAVYRLRALRFGLPRRSRTVVKAWRRRGATQKFTVRGNARGRARRDANANIGTGRAGLGCGAHNRLLPVNRKSGNYPLYKSLPA